MDAIAETLPDLRAPYAETTVGPNRVALLKDGYQALPAMLRAIAAAEHTICFETYIFREDATGRKFIEALTARAVAGVEVLLMYDAWGSDLSDDTRVEMQTVGIKVLTFRPWRYLGSLSRAFARVRRRNHRKSLIVDGTTGFTGGLNISDDYAAPEDGGRGWRDTHVRVVGPGAVALERLFLKTWQDNRGPAFEKVRFRRLEQASGSGLRVVGNEFSATKKAIRNAYAEAILKSRSRIFITNAYFLPPAKMIRALVAATRRGVRVAVILAATTDVKMVLFAARGLYANFLKHGIEVYEWNASAVLHAKTAVVDGQWATIGSANLDALSLRHNLEVNALVVDHHFGEAMEQLFLDDLKNCQAITLADVKQYGIVQRVLSWLAFQFRHWL
jgi:cardiolipin synthase